MNYINKKTVTAFVLGLIIALFSVHAYTVYQIRGAVLQNQAVIAEIVGLINSSGPAGAPQAPQLPQN